MKIIISPAKIMNEGIKPYKTSKPVFLDDALYIYNFLKEQDEDTLKTIWECNDKIVKENLLRLEQYDLLSNTVPAILLYNGLQFKKMEPPTFTSKMNEYINNHLVILSGLYGYLRPFDGINPYRLMMMANIKLKEGNLYNFWKDKIYKELIKDDHIILNLASKEYSDVLTPYLTSDITFIDVSFLSKNKKGELINKSTEAKTSRGAMVKYLASINATSLEDVKKYKDYNYSYSEELSSPNHFVFVKE